MTGDFKVTIGEAYTPMMVLGVLKKTQIYEKFKNETNRITEGTTGIMRNLKTEGLGKEIENLCKQGTGAKLAHIKDPKKYKHKRNLQVT